MDLIPLIYALSFFGSPSLGYLIVRFSFPDIRIYPWNVKLSISTFFGLSVFLIALLFSFFYAFEGFVLGLAFGPFVVLVVLDSALRVRRGSKIAIPRVRIKLPKKPEKVGEKEAKEEEKGIKEKAKEAPVERAVKEEKEVAPVEKEKVGRKKELTPYERHRLKRLGLQALPQEKKVVEIEKLVEEPLPEELDLSAFEEETELEKVFGEEPELEEELDMDKLQDVAGISEVEQVPKKKVCPRCGSSKGTIIYCPYCGKGMCTDCVPIARREGGFAVLKCPYCGKEIYVKLQKKK